MKPVTGKDFAKALEAKGWRLHHIKGSHHYYVKEGETIMPSVPIHAGKTLKPGTQSKLMKDTGLTDSDL